MDPISKKLKRDLINMPFVIYLKADTVILEPSAGEVDTGNVKEEALDELAGLLERAGASPVSRRLRPRPARPDPPSRRSRATRERKPKI